MKIAIYVRISKRNNQTTENQELILVEYANKMGYTYDIYREEESTRKTRPIKYALMQKLRNKEYDGVLILKLDRFARSIQELIMDVKELTDKGIKFESLRDSIDLSTATGRLQFHILCSFAEFERDLIRERTLDGLERVRNSKEYKSGKKTLGRQLGSKNKKTIKMEKLNNLQIQEKIEYLNGE